MPRRFPHLLPAIMLSAACFGRGEPTTPGETPPPGHPPAISIFIGPAGGAISVGKTLQFQATANITAAGWQWSSRNPAVASVGPAGLVLGMSPGTAQIQACASNAPTFCGLAELTVVAAPENNVPEVKLAPLGTTLNVGQTLEFMATALHFAEPAWNWFSIDPNTATVSEDGKVTGRRPGVAVVAACAPTAPKYCGTAVIQVQ